MCDVCCSQASSGRGAAAAAAAASPSSSSPARDVTACARGLLDALAGIHAGGKQATMLQLVDAWKKSPSGKSAEGKALGSEARLMLWPPSRKNVRAVRGERAYVDRVVLINASQDAMELICHMLLEGALSEEFQNTAYATNVYLKPGQRAAALQQGRLSFALAPPVPQPAGRAAAAGEGAGPRAGGEASEGDSDVLEISDDRRPPEAAGKANKRRREEEEAEEDDEEGGQRGRRQ